MRIVLNDYSGHSFQVELSRELARRGHTILHLHFADFQTPKGDLVGNAEDPQCFAVKGIGLGEPFQKNNLVRRRGQEIRYAYLIRNELASFHPDIVIGCNNPLDAQGLIQSYCLSNKILFVFWLQDLYSGAIRSILGAKAPGLGHLVGLVYERLEKQMLRRSAHVIAITDEFLRPLGAWGVDRDRISIIENWAPRNQILPGVRNGPWSRAHGVGDCQLVLYTGTLGLKHNPDLILALARKFARWREEVKVAVASEGSQADYLRGAAVAERLSSLVVLPFQPIKEYSDALASADVLIAMIGRDAAAYSVPSKVLSYHCSGRAIVLSAAKSNLAARIILAAGSGIVTAPEDQDGFVAAGETLLDDDAQRLGCGGRARAYADKKFDIAPIGERFESLLLSCMAASPNQSVGRRASASIGRY
jgi:colanic acid biosynthesis glycosyl transferase WcaI